MKLQESVRVQEMNIKTRLSTVTAAFLFIVHQMKPFHLLRVSFPSEHKASAGLETNVFIFRWDLLLLCEMED